MKFQPSDWNRPLLYLANPERLLAFDPHSGSCRTILSYIAFRTGKRLWNQTLVWMKPFISPVKAHLSVQGEWVARKRSGLYHWSPLLLIIQTRFKTKPKRFFRYVPVLSPIGLYMIKWGGKEVKDIRRSLRRSDFGGLFGTRIMLFHHNQPENLWLGNLSTGQDIDRFLTRQFIWNKPGSNLGSVQDILTRYTYNIYLKIYLRDILTRYIVRYLHGTR